VLVGLGVAATIAATVMAGPSAAMASPATGTGPCPDEICGMNHNQVLL